MKKRVIKLKAETLIETIVASVILLISLMLALIIINQVVLTKSPGMRMIMQDAIENQFYVSEKKNKLESTTIPFKDFMIKQTVENFEEDIKIIDIQAYKSDTVFVTGSKRYIYCGKKNTSIYSY